MNKILVAPSILSADFSKLGEEILLAENSGADYIHYDVMDGHYVNNISLGVPVVKSTSKIHHLINDVHLMISEPKKYIEAFAKAGADIITFHVEVCKDDLDVFHTIDLIHSFNVKAGISINLKTPVEQVVNFLDKVDMVLVMSVEAGFGGQSFSESALYKISVLKQIIDKKRLNCVIQVDGGINFETAALCKKAGANCLVAGSYLFGHEDIKERIEGLKK